MHIHRPAQAIANGLGFLVRDRRSSLIPVQPIPPNITLADISQVAGWHLLNLRQEAGTAANYVRDLSIRPAILNRPVMYLSGGNQQKVCLARWLFSKARILIVDELARGIDVGAKAEVFALINQLAERGVAIIMISSEMVELLAMADRTLVMRAGRFAAEYARGEATQELLAQTLQDEFTAYGLPGFAFYLVGALKVGAADYVVRDREMQYLELLRVVIGRVLDRQRMLSEKQQMFQVVQESEERYRYLFEMNPLPMWVVDSATGAFLEVNRAAGEHYGYTRPEFLRLLRGMVELPDPDDGAGSAASRRPSARRHRKRRGEVIEVETVSHAVNYGGIRAEVVLCHDVTERKRGQRG